MILHKILVLCRSLKPRHGLSSGPLAPGKELLTPHSKLEVLPEARVLQPAGQNESFVQMGHRVHWDLKHSACCSFTASENLDLEGSVKYDLSGLISLGTFIIVFIPLRISGLTTVTR